ncbi:sulfotransferase domain-containing protein [Labilibacter sediminis]|nr:sulfotransferase domain-containing protein [Labilibacter sediminis]
MKLINKLIRPLQSLLRKSPDFIIVGVQKGGTTSLYNYLTEHPDIAPACTKEVHYFDYNYHKGKNWYAKHFPFKWKAKGKITGESSPYYIYHPQSLKRIKQDFPNVKIIVMLREPLSRAFSHYHMELRRGNEKIRPFEQAIKQESIVLEEHQKLLENPKYYSFPHQTYSYISRGYYVKQIKEIYELFPNEQVLILKSENFYSNTQEEYLNVCNFLKIPAFELPNIKIHNKGTYKKEEFSKELKSIFINSNNELKELLGYKIY